MKRWIIVLSALVLLQSGIIVKQARTIAKADAKAKLIDFTSYAEVDTLNNELARLSEGQPMNEFATWKNYTID